MFRRCIIQKVKSIAGSIGSPQSRQEADSREFLPRPERSFDPIGEGGMGRDGVPHFSPCSAWCKTPFGFEIGKQKHRAGGRTRYMVPRIQFKRSGTAARRTVFPLPADRQKVYYSHGADLCHVGPYQENILPYKDSTMPVWELTLILRDDIIILCQQTVNGDRVVAWSYNRLWKMLIDKKMKRTDLLCIYQHENIIPYGKREIHFYGRLGKDQQVALLPDRRYCRRHSR